MNHGWYNPPPEDFCWPRYEEYLAEFDPSDGDEPVSYEDWVWDNAETLNEDYNDSQRG